jgi:hypothetical protein
VRWTTRTPDGYPPRRLRGNRGFERHAAMSSLKLRSGGTARDRDRTSGNAITPRNQGHGWNVVSALRPQSRLRGVIQCLARSSHTYSSRGRRNAAKSGRAEQRTTTA